MDPNLGCWQAVLIPITEAGTSLLYDAHGVWLPSFATTHLAIRLNGPGEKDAFRFAFIWRSLH